MRRLPIFWRLSLSYLPAVVLALLIVFAGDDTRQDGVNAAAWRSQSLVVGAVVLAVLAAVVGLVSSERISRSLQVMRASAEHFADGDFSHRLRIPNTPEMGNLAATLNDMAAQLEDQISVVTQQRNEQEAILGSMQEGVLALDPQAHVIAMNPAAEALLAVSAAQARGRTVQEVIRNVGLQRLLADAMSKAEPTTGEIVLRGDAERFLQGTATALHDAAGRDLGMLVVLNDITQIRRLEIIRRDFVANVSHELKTPITSIKGFVETLRDGALDDRPQAERFLEIVARHADRLHAIIEDLLSLSRLEQNNEIADTPPRSSVASHHRSRGARLLHQGRGTARRGRPFLCVRPARQGQRPAAGTGHRQSAGQRHQLQQCQRHGVADGAAGKRRGAHRRARRGHRHRAGTRAAHLRTFLSRRQGARPAPAAVRASAWPS